MDHPVQFINRCRIVSSGHAGNTHITDPKTGERLLFVMNAALRIEDGLWVADLTVSPVEFDIEAQVSKRVMHCPNCKSERVL